MLLWASKFATARIECSFEMGKEAPSWGYIYFDGNGALVHFISHCGLNKYNFYWFINILLIYIFIYIYIYIKCTLRGVSVHRRMVFNVTLNVSSYFFQLL